MSPLSISPIGPPTAASGATCPIDPPLVAPEKRPSVIRTVESPRPAPIIAPVTASISCIPGPPFGPSYRITTTSPSTISPLVTASKAPRSPSKTLAGPSCFSILVPATLITAPSGAKLPFNIAKPPVELFAFGTEKITRSSGLVETFSRFSSRVLPLIDLALPCKRPAFSSSFNTT